MTSAPACICSNRTRSRSSKNAAAHRRLKNNLQMPAFLHGPLWNQMHARADVMENTETLAKVLAKPPTHAGALRWG